ncbi:uncharacterized protein Z518_05439 [Rhinocladiella mackenziei CBS 650.93]|uniref:Uncharacterized protein n=1 Tax=Rhinocladiella mackenziei CBS 650.93 TaxID=1442369 RepID=A0A0D2IFH9_9EURO|nr:uncharacterized protein Z518_05439 [Rhinocladiella mackenziei CBS 650.93]KIX04569.1 hypothetical protein Z518_05439 [Rhinocladiella mackenziei CBS 650.93]
MTTEATSVPEFGQYTAVPPSVSTTSFSDGATTSSISLTSEETTAPSSIDDSSSPTRTDSPENSTSTTSSQFSSTPTVSAEYNQILNPGIVANIQWNTFATSDFDVLCPSHDCVKDCQNYTRLFEEVPYLITESLETYGKSVDGQAPNITLFGVCSNLANVYAGIASDTEAVSKQSYFPLSSQEDVGPVSMTLASCLASTCDYSRESQNCISACNLDVLYSGGSATNLTAVTGCLSLICGNTCGLPYANQDVMGVGVLVSYIIQAILVIACAVALISSAILYTRQPRGEEEETQKLSDNTRRGLEGFLAAQCYFTIALEIAALCSAPWTTDPLTGYALLSVAITGFLCPIFTLMLLHSHGCRSWYGGFLAVLSYVLASIVFWALFENLSPHIGSTTSSDETLHKLYQISSCGNSSAIALCPQTIGNDPLEYLAGFYNQGNIPNLQTAPLLWGWSTLILIVLSVNQIGHSLGLRREAPSRPQSPIKSARTWVIRVLNHPVTLFLACTLFGLCLGYQARMLLKYSRSDVIDWDGWSFGQVVAVVIWIQPVADYLRLWLRDHLRRDHQSNKGNPTPMPQSSTRGKGGYPVVSQGHGPALGTPTTSAFTPSLQPGRTHSSPGSSALNPATTLPTYQMVARQTY